MMWGGIRVLVQLRTVLGLPRGSRVAARKAAPDGLARDSLRALLRDERWRPHEFGFTMTPALVSTTY